MTNSFVGKYRAYVHDINDPEKRGRIQVLCPMVLGDYPSNWCEPCIPVAYDNGGDFALPKVGETVWVEFEQGIPNKPIWTGNWFSEKKSPLADEYNTDTRVITWGDCKIICKEKEMTLSVGKSSILLTNSGIVITAPSVNFKKG